MEKHYADRAVRQSWEDIKNEEAKRRVHRPLFESDEVRRRLGPATQARWTALRRSVPTSSSTAVQVAAPLESGPSQPSGVETLVRQPFSDGMNPLLKAEAMWEAERATLVSSRDALQASLVRERAWRADTARRCSTLTEENTALREALAAALSAPFGEGTSGVTVSLRQYTDLLTLARQYRQTLLDLKTLQGTVLSDPDGAVDSLFAAFPLEVAPLPHNPLADDVAATSSSLALLKADTGEQVACGPAGGAHAEKYTVPGSDEEPQAEVTKSITDLGTQLRTPSPTPLKNGLALSPPPPFPPAARAPLTGTAPFASASPSADASPPDRDGAAIGVDDTPMSDREPLHDRSPEAPSPLPREPGGPPVWRREDDAGQETADYAGPAGAVMGRFPSITTVLPGKLDLEIFSARDARGVERWQRWAIVNRTASSTFTVEYRFATTPVRLCSSAASPGECGIILLSGARLTQDGRCVMTVAPGKRRLFLEGNPGRYTVIVRSDSSSDTEGCGGGSDAKAPSKRTETATTETPLTRGTEDEVNGGVGGAPSRRSETMPPSPSVTAQPREPSATAPLRRNAPSSMRPFMMRSGTPQQEDAETVVAEMDRLTTELIKGLTALAGDFKEDDPVRLAALCRSRGLDYVDASFPPLTVTLGNGAAGFRLYDAQLRRTFYVRWCAPALHTPNTPRAVLLSSVGVDPCALSVGPLGDMGVVAALAALAESGGAVTSMLASTTSEDEENGIFSVWLCYGGEWRLVRVDGYLPYVAEDSVAARNREQLYGDEGVSLETGPVPYGCINVLSTDLWGSLCEKAIAKTLGSYRALRGVSAAHALGLFTGGPVEVWDWWHHRSDVAFDEIEAAMNTSARGSGIVLITTRASISAGVVATPTHRRRGGSPPSTISALPGEDGVDSTLEKASERSFRSAGLLPCTTYRVLAASENEDGEPMLLVRNWQRRTLDEVAAPVQPGAHTRRQSCHMSPERDDMSTTADAKLCVAMAVVRSADSCLWLNYTKEVLPFFTSCHVCFDCRRYHDLRVPVSFLVEHQAPSLQYGYFPAGAASRARRTTPAVPSHLLRVTVKRVRVAAGAAPPPPARMWIGLHQPTTSSCADDSASLPYGLKVSLIGHDEALTARQRQSTETALAPPAYYILSESYAGEPQSLPAVWMYVELTAPESTATESTEREGNTEGGDGEDDEPPPLVFYVLPQLEPVPTGNSGAAPLRRLSSTTPLGRDAGDRPVAAALALLAEDRDRFDVELLVAPDELKAALYHDVLERLDLAGCRTVGAPSGTKPSNTRPSPPTRGLDSSAKGRIWSQLNGKWQEGFSW